MASYLLDTNVLVRFLTDDHAEHLAETKELFTRAEKGEHSLAIVSLVVAETIFVLRSVYKHDYKEIAGRLQIFLSQRWLKVEERQILLAALSLLAIGTHFVDAYLAARANSDTVEIYTFDKKLKKMAAGS